MDRLNYIVLASHYYFGKLHKNERVPKKGGLLEVPEDGWGFPLCLPTPAPCR